MSGRPSSSPARTRWALIYGTLTLGAVAADVAVTEAIDGAATAPETRLLAVAGVLAVLSLTIGISLYVAHSPADEVGRNQRGRGRLAVLMGLAAGTVGVGRLTSVGGRLVRHVGLDRDEPLTTASLALQTAVAFAAHALLVAFALHESRLVRRQRLTRQPASTRPTARARNSTVAARRQRARSS